VTTRESARLFVALQLPVEIRRALFAWGREHVGGVTRLRLVDPESLHVTLCFLGSRPAAEVGEIEAACRVVSGLPAAPLSVARALWLPPRRPRVLTIALTDDAGRLGAVQSALSDALAAGGFYEPEARPFRPHVTVARVQREARPHRGELPPPEPLRFVGGRVTLYRSRPASGPAHYEALSTLELLNS
jgi:RNA 2',3'-cyclic 3'-phosphodiesterase